MRPRRRPADAPPRRRLGRRRRLRLQRPRRAGLPGPLRRHHAVRIRRSRRRSAPRRRCRRSGSSTRSWCVENDVVSTFLRFHPLLENQRLAGSAVELERLADTVSWRLDGNDDLFEGMHRHHRRVVRKAEAELEVEAREPPDRLDAFTALYEAAMRRAGRRALLPLSARVLGQARERRARPPRVLRRRTRRARSSRASSASPRRRGSTTTSAQRSSLPARSVRATCSCSRRPAGAGRRATSSSTSAAASAAARTRSGSTSAASRPARREAWIGKLVHDEAAYFELAGAQRPLRVLPGLPPPAASG